MTLMTIKDFRARPCSIEYIALYIACSSSIIAIAAASFGQLEPSWGIATATFVGVCAAFLSSCRIKRPRSGQTILS